MVEDIDAPRTVGVEGENNAGALAAAIVRRAIQFSARQPQRSRWICTVVVRAGARVYGGKVVEIGETSAVGIE